MTNLLSHSCTAKSQLVDNHSDDHEDISEAGGNRLEGFPHHWSNRPDALADEINHSSRPW